MHRALRLLPFLFALQLAAIVLLGQDFRATISGQVTDPSNAALPGVTVKAVNVGTNETVEAITNDEGYYTLPYLTPGTYNVEASLAGFAPLRREGIVLRVADKLNLPLKLKIGEISQAITVVGEQELIETGSADRGLVYDPIKVQEYPLNGRQTYMLMSLTPGVIFTQEQFGSSGFSGTRGWDVNSSYRINGARTGQNLFLLNGAPISNNGGSWQLAPNVEAVQEFKVMTNTYDAGYGRFGGGVVNTTIKSGSNNWHGDIFEYWRNRIFDANSFQNNTIHGPKGFHNQHQFGGVAGGPIRKDKDFIFGSFEGWQEVVPFPAVSSTAPVLLRDGQHFTDLGYKVYDPLTIHVCGTKPGETTAVCQGQTYIRDQFPGNVIPANRLSPVGAKILSYYPAPNAPGLNNNFVAAGNLGRYYYQQPMVRWDHVFGPNDKLNAMWTYQQGFEYRDSTGFGKPAANGNVNNERFDMNIILSETHVMSPTTVLDFRASFGRFTQTTPGPSDLSLSAKSIGMTEMIHSPTSEFDVVPTINDGGGSEYTRIFSTGSVFTWNTYNQWNFTPSLSMNRGRHTLRSGFEINYVARADINLGASNGTFQFSPGWTQQLPARRLNATDGSTAATMLLGTPTGGSIAYNNTFYRTRPYYGLYVQDDWKVSPSVTLNLGLRYDVQVPWLERYNRTNRGFDPSVKSPLSDQILANWAKLKADYDKANPNAKYKYPAPPAALTGAILFPGVDGQPRRIYETDWTNFAPRVGIAWRVRGNTVIRAGGGVYYQSPTQNNTTFGFSQSTPYTTSLDGGLTPSARLNGPYSLVNPFPNGLAVPPGSSAGALTGIGGGISFDPPHYRIPRTYQYSFGIQQQLPYGIVGEVSFAGNYQNHIDFGYDMNHQSLANQQIAIADPSYYNRTLPNPFFGILPVTTGLGGSATTTGGTLLRPDPIFSGSITNNLVQQGKYRSDALQVKVERRTFGESSKTGVLTWVLSYTFSKSYEQNHRLNDWNDKEPPIREIDFQDKPQNIAFSGVWDLPFGANRRFDVGNPLARAIVSNWRFDWIYTYLSGYPVGWPNLINNCSSWHAAKQDEDHWFNNDKSCYVQFPTNSLRTIPDRFSDIRQPAVGPQLNAAVEKTMHFAERYRVQFRLEAFNATNHPIRGNVDTGFTSATFGRLPKSQNNFPRFLQIAGKLYF